MKEICIIRSNAVRPDSRVEKEAWSLSKAGYNIRVLAWDRDSTHAPVDEQINVNGVTIPITRIGFKATFGEGFKNIKAYMGFQFAMRKWIRTHLNQLSVVHACDFDTAFFSYSLCKRKGIKFVFDIFDFLASNPKTLFQKIIRKAQYRIINKADATIICTEDRRRQIAGSKPKRLVVIHNTPALAELSENSFIKVTSNRPRIVYVGILQDYRLLFEIGDFFINNNDVEFHIGGFGKYEDHFKELAEKSDNIYFYGRIPYEKTLQLESECDIMLSIYDPKIHNHLFAAPNKFYESLMLGKPVIMVNNTGMSEVVKNEGIGAIIDYSYKGFSEGIRALISRKNEWPQISEKMKKLYMEQFSWNEMENRLIGLYQELLN